MASKYKVREAVVVTISHPWKTEIHTIITSTPVLKKRKISAYFKDLFGITKSQREIVTYKYLCKCRYGVAFFTEQQLKRKMDASNIKNMIETSTQQIKTIIS